MEQPVYSKIYPTDQRDYRYNYTTQKLQRIEKRIRFKEINGINCSVVESEVTAEFDVRHQLWDKMPEYWVQLYDSEPRRVAEWLK
ncbi:hypothetical protein C814_01042 [Anaerotruncus sp. G3(2012)]|uniref:hypothetical protein n=1 Tax=Anaerotruncus sp. G3(2012) TaxID=1235835 RepID=UPI00033DBFBC|nr:hypothetical protein [Anaerotruncus sp. G3(2012)]EOS62894.1 hypothetical protein C814_01042 [Anaerotruncus sp. G3(2012)]